jgi:hypothetical protein
MQLEHDFKKELKSHFDIDFNSLFTITNIPISRFLDFLIESGNYEDYMEKLINAFNPSAVSGVMCRNTISIDWQGNLFDCDFNQMLGLKKHINHMVITLAILMSQNSNSVRLPLANIASPVRPGPGAVVKAQRFN